MQFRKFTQKDFPVYQTWFEKESINRFLGPNPDEAWLQHILKEEEGIQYAVYEEAQLLAVVGLIFPTSKHPYFVVTDIVIDPKKQTRGKGRSVMYQLLKKHPVDENIHYKTYVDNENIAAQSFFKKLGWQLENIEADEDGMLCFEYYK